ncbi:MAG: hypothetical protein ISR97_02720 [Nitrospira sp.]|nr:hypothetical protein [Nitrospira sp.]
MKKLSILLIIITGILSYDISEAVMTNLVVRAKSKDAKFIGTKMGAKIVIRDTATGKVLAEGFTSGGTGNTQKIMIEPKTRFGQISEGAAKFETSIDIDEPTLITVDVEAPYTYKENTIKNSTQIWLIPGRDIVGEGLVVEVPGFSVNISAPGKAKLVNGEAVIPIQASIVMI